MSYSGLTGIVGTPQVGLAGLAGDTPPRLQPGLITGFVDNWFGMGEFAWGRASAAIRTMGLCQFAPVFDSTLSSWRFDVAEVANTANLGVSLCVATQAFTTGQYGWFAISGLIPVNGTSSLTAGTAIGIVAAGQSGVNSAGKQILNARVAAAATTTVIKAGCNAFTASNQLQIPNDGGWFVGAFLSGTGIAGGTTVLAIDASGRFVTLSANTTAAIVGGSITATYNNGTIFYNLVHLNRPFAQGAIT
jgi:hypothetical protein